MTTSALSGAQFYSTAQHQRPTIGDFGDDTTPERVQLGEPNPVHQGVSDVAPYTSQNNSSAGTLTAWRTHRNAASRLPQPHSKRTMGSFVSFD